MFFWTNQILLYAVLLLVTFRTLLATTEPTFRELHYYV